MERTYHGSKELSIDPNLYGGYKILNWYEVKGLLQRGPYQMGVHGFFLADVHKEERLSSEMHFPILFTDSRKAASLFESLNSHSDVKLFVESLDLLITQNTANPLLQVVHAR